MSTYMIPAELMIARLRAKAGLYEEEVSAWAGGAAAALLAFANMLESELETHRLLEDGRPKA